MHIMLQYDYIHKTDSMTVNIAYVIKWIKLTSKQDVYLDEI